MTPSNHTCFACALMTALALAGAGCSGRAPAHTADRPPAVAVRTATVAIGDRAETFDAGGIVRAVNTATVTARILAPVLAVNVAAGDRVRRGQVLVVLDGPDLRATARSGRSAAASAEAGGKAAAAEARAADASLALARATHQRIADLHGRRSATAQELDEAAAALHAAEARVAAAAAHVQEAALAIDAARASADAAAATESFTRISAPFDGLVTEKLIESGNTAAPGLPLLRIEDTRAFRLEVRVDESRVAHIRTGAAVAVLLEGHAGAPIELAGTVAELARALDTDMRAVLVKIALPAHASLQSGLFARARFTAGAGRAVLVPAEALVRHGQVASVFVVEGGIARLRLVDVSGGEVRAGLAAGERVVIDPPADLADGRMVSEGARQ